MHLLELTWQRWQAPAQGGCDWKCGNDPLPCAGQIHIFSTHVIQYAGHVSPITYGLVTWRRIAKNPTDRGRVRKSWPYRRDWRLGAWLSLGKSEQSAKPQRTAEWGHWALGMSLFYYIRVHIYTSCLCTLRSAAESDIHAKRKHRVHDCITSIRKKKYVLVRRLHYSVCFHSYRAKVKIFERKLSYRTPQNIIQS